MPTDENISINYLMLEQHRALSVDIAKLVANDLDEGSRALLRGQFLGKLERHMRLEERVIYSYSDWVKDGLAKMLVNLLSDDLQIREILKNIDWTSQQASSESILELDKYLNEHERHECEEFYPKMDKVLSDKERSILIEKIMKYDDKG